MCPLWLISYSDATRDMHRSSEQSPQAKARHIHCRDPARAKAATVPDTHHTTMRHSRHPPGKTLRHCTPHVPILLYSNLQPHLNTKSLQQAPRTRRQIQTLLKACAAGLLRRVLHAGHCCLIATAGVAAVGLLMCLLPVGVHCWLGCDRCWAVVTRGCCYCHTAAVQNAPHVEPVHPQLPKGGSS